MKPVVLPAVVNPRLLIGVAEAAASAFIEGVTRERAAPVTLVLARTARQLDSLAEDILFFHRLAVEERPAWEILLYPELPEIGADDQRAFERHCDRLAALAALTMRRERPESMPLVVVTTLAALLQPAPRPEDLAAHEIRLAPGARVKLGALAERLGHELGYDSEVLCETPGHYAVRGGLVDVYPYNADAPCRLDFFGDEIESIRRFDPTTQLTGEALKEIVIAPAPRNLAGNAAPAGLLAFLSGNVHWVVQEPARQAAEGAELFAQPEKIVAVTKPTLQTVLAARSGAQDAWTGLAELDEDGGPFPAAAERVPVDSEPTLPHRRPALVPALGHVRLESELAAQRDFLRTLADWARAGVTVVVATRAEGEAGRLREILAEDPELREFQPTIVTGELTAGFRAQFGKPAVLRLAWPALAGAAGVAVVAEGEIFGRHRQRIATFRARQLPQRHRVDQLLDFAEMVEGDYLVHLAHGVCRFRGLRKLDTKGRREEVISLEFADGVELHLPLHESHLLTRYVGLAKIAPRLGKVGGNQWEKTRHDAERATLDFAAQLLRLQAERDQRTGVAHPPDAPWQAEFEAAFPHEETPDQLRAIVEVKADLERARPMDRLLCGDVGFGKTEVALRAAFKVVLGGKQVAVLAPTTVLVQQHCNTFRERLAPFPISVEQLSRFRTKRQQKQVLAQLRDGRLDMVIGTHRLLSADVKFKDLGLVIIDEEHRFGVRHKERLKHLRAQVDVLAMSATPIPRTLYFALVGARDLSVIETPPRDRLPIETVVKSFSPELVRDAIRAELARGGQVFYLHNRVETIEEAARLLRELVPEARLGVGHGQMEADDLERLMTRFVAGEFDVLVCTTIIESGLDIPNCNTLIIEGADRFGLAQLYQLRGRIGRFNRQAYAYLLLHRHARLLDDARKRLAALRQFNQPGAGFRLAMRDLELRGAGNLLGAEQSGHIAGVGFDLYCQLLRQSIARLKGEPAALTLRASVRLGFVLVGEAVDPLSQGDTAPTYAVATDDTGDRYAALKQAELAGQSLARIAAGLPAAYIADTRLRLDQYRRFALAATPAEVAGLADALRDRFGPLPESAEALVKLAKIRVWAEQKRLGSVETEGDRLKCQRAGRRRGEAARYVQLGHRFPRLTGRHPLQRMDEIIDFLKRLETEET
jgi:transcription-repair coupling factor (superfamily II helicase)